MATFQATLKGILYIIGGMVLLLHTLGIMEESLNYVLIAGSIVMILYGLTKSGIMDLIITFIEGLRAKTGTKSKKSKTDE